MKKLSILIPAYNEERTILQLLNRLKSLQLPEGLDKELILVNDCSTDKTEQLIKSFINDNRALDVQYFLQEKNCGKGAAIRKAISLSKGDYLIVQDADLEYDPREYNKLLTPLLEGNADVVYGSRFIGGNPHRVLFFWHSIGNKFLTFLSNMFTNLNLTDMETCYKLMDAKIAKSLELNENRFGFEPEITAKLARIPNIRIFEVGISYYGRTYEEGKKIGWKDGFRAIYCIFKYGLLH